MSDREIMLDLVEDIDNMRGECTDWEAEFLESIFSRINNFQNLSSKQEECLRKIHRKYEDQRAFK